jgi:hypothetical protein
MEEEKDRQKEIVGDYGREQRFVQTCISISTAAAGSPSSAVAAAAPRSASASPAGSSCSRDSRPARS